MVRIAERYVGDQFRHLDMTQNRALPRNNPDAAWSGLPDIPLRVDLHAIGDAGPRIAVEIDQQPAVGEHAVSLDVIGTNEALAAAVGTEHFLVGRAGEAVGMGNVPDHRAAPTNLQPETTRETDAGPWVR